MSEQNEIPNNAKDWAEYVRRIDYSDHKKAILGLGIAAAIGIGAGVAVASRHKRISIGYADRHFQQKGVISLVDMDGQVAIGLPTSDQTYDEVGDGAELFLTSEHGKVYHNRSPLGNQHVGVLRKIGGWLAEHFEIKHESS